MKTEKNKTVIKKDSLAQCLLEHAARETSWAAQSGKECNYKAASDALLRRQVWLHAALLAQEQKR